MSQSGKVLKKLKQVTIICTIFIVLEVLGGVLANSIAIISDALHLLSDVIAFLMSAFVVWLSTQKPPSWLPFGYHKAQPLGALLNILMVYFVTIYLFIEATQRIMRQEVVEKPCYMLITSLFGLGCNLIMMKILHSGDTPHHEGCSHHHHSTSSKSKGKSNNQVEGHLINPVSIHHDHLQHNCSQSSRIIQEIGTFKPQKLNHSHNDIVHVEPHHHSCSTQDHSSQHFDCGDQLHHHHEHQNELHEHKQDVNQNLNIQAAYIHILGDIILSIGVAIAACIIYFSTNEGDPYSHIHLADPICTYLFSVLVLVVSTPVLKKSVTILLDGSLDSTLVPTIKHELSKSGFKEYNDLKIWSISSSEHMGSISVDHNISKQQISELKKIFDRSKVKLFINIGEV